MGEEMGKGSGEPCPNSQKGAWVLPLSSLPQAAVCLVCQEAGDGAAGLVPSCGSVHAPMSVCVREYKARTVPVWSIPHTDLGSALSGT